ncbi:MAG: hypothetical protein AAGM22_17420 [Acidobacteriota bacterium]
MWIWSDPVTLEEATAILISTVETAQGTETAAVMETRVYLESPQSNRAEVTFKYNPDSAGFDLTFRDSVSGWKAEVERGFLFEDEGILPIPQERWMDELFPRLNNPDVEGIGYVRVRLGHGIEISAEQATHPTPAQGRDEATMLKDSLMAWIADLSEEELLQDWDFPPSALEMLHFLAIAEAEPLRESINLIEALVSTGLSASAELEDRRNALVETPVPAEITRKQLKYGRRDWAVAEGSLDGNEADRAGARTTIALIRKELAAYE